MTIHRVTDTSRAVITLPRLLQARPVTVKAMARQEPLVQPALVILKQALVKPSKVLA